MEYLKGSTSRGRGFVGIAIVSQRVAECRWAGRNLFLDDAAARLAER
jgi:hypothetical protein